MDRDVLSLLLLLIGVYGVVRSWRAARGFFS